jgi:2-polyprenyl-6-methoxyphenol hydroxylase-like FAD-dependent oxidoreductase
MRGELIQLLAETLPEGILMLDHAVDKILENDENRVQVRVRRGDGSTITMEGDVLIGADGIHSTVRQECFGSKTKEFVGLNLIYFVIPAKDIQDIIDTNPLLQSDAMMAIDDPSGLLLPSGSEENRSWIFCSAYRSQYAIQGVEEWEQPKEGGNEDVALQQVLDKIAAASENGGAAIPLQAMLQHATRKMNFSLYQTLPCHEEWYRNRMVLVGDAIHATTPFLGRGANEAIQSAACLARLLGSYADKGGMELATCTRLFEEYRDNRYPKTKDVIERSEKVGRMRTGTSFLERTYRHFVFRVMFMNNALLYRKIMAKETQSSV